MIVFDDLSNLLEISNLCNIHPIVSKSIVKDKIDVVSKLTTEDKKEDNIDVNSQLIIVNNNEDKIDDKSKLSIRYTGCPFE